MCYNRNVMCAEQSPPRLDKPPRIEVIGITGIPEIEAGVELGDIIVAAATAQGSPLQSGDILIVTQKIVSKAEGRTVDLQTIEPSDFATRLAKETDRDPRLIELVLRESRAIVRMDLSRGIIITETRHGFVCANAGIDSSNVPGEDMVVLLPIDSDESARGIRTQVLRAVPDGPIGVIISDTFGRAWREGHANIAIGVAGIDPLKDYKGTVDANGQTLKVTNIAVADELTGAAELVTAKAINVPVAIVRGYEYDENSDGVQTLVRHPSRDLFR